MNYFPIADTGLIVFLIFFGIPVTVIVFILSIVSEALMMWFQGWDSLKRSLLDSFIMNLVSLIAAIIVGANNINIFEPFFDLIIDEWSTNISSILFFFTGSGRRYGVV